MIKPAPPASEQPAENRGDGHFEYRPLPGAHPPGMQRRIAIVGTMPRAIIEAAPHRCVAANPQFGEHRRRIGAAAIAPPAIGGGLDAERSGERRVGKESVCTCGTRWVPG